MPARARAQGGGTAAPGGRDPILAAAASPRHEGSLASPGGAGLFGRLRFAFSPRKSWLPVTGAAMAIMWWWILVPRAAADPLKLADSGLEPVKWSALAGWIAADHLTAFHAYQASCQILRKTRDATDGGLIYNAVWDVC